MPRITKIIPLLDMKQYDDHYNSDQIIVNENDSEEELTEISKEVCSTIGEKIYKFKLELQKSQELLDKNYYKDENKGYVMNKNFEEIEYIEENLDSLFYKFKEIKKEISKARLANHYIEDKKKVREIDEIFMKKAIIVLGLNKL
jgi:hypothetical protein